MKDCLPSLVERVVGLAEDLKEVEENRNAIMADLAPHIEAWRVFVKIFDQSWVEANTTPSHKPAHYPWGLITGGSNWSLPHAHQAYDYTLFVETDVAVDQLAFHFNGEDDGDWHHYRIPVAFTNPDKSEACRAKLVGEWIAVAEERKLQEAAKRVTREKQEYERLKEKYEK